MYECLVLADSIAAGVRLTTMQVTFPRIVLAEFNTHRVFSRNSASSRAIPVEKQIERVLDNPFIPTYWGKNQKGMQAEVELDDMECRQAVLEWLLARDHAVSRAKCLLNIGVHKQLTNRLLEPFMWHTVVVTATEWENFFALRCSPEAQPEIRIIAEMMWDEYSTHVPETLRPGEWHLPYTTAGDRSQGYAAYTLAQISAARTARVSYLTHDGERDVRKDIALCQRLIQNGHLSPLEHPAVVADERGDQLPVTSSMFNQKMAALDYGNFRYPWIQLRKFIPNEDVHHVSP